MQISFRHERIYVQQSEAAERKEEIIYTEGVMQIVVDVELRQKQAEDR